MTGPGRKGRRCPELGVAWFRRVPMASRDFRRGTFPADPLHSIWWRTGILRTFLSRRAFEPERQGEAVGVSLTIAESIQESSFHTSGEPIQIP